MDPNISQTRKEANRKYRFKHFLTKVEDEQGKAFKQDFIKEWAFLCGCSVHKLEPIWLAYFWQDDRRFCCPIAYMRMFQELYLNLLGESLTDEELIHPDAKVLES